MYITNMELIKQKLTAEGRLSTSDIIKQILKDDDANPAKQYMLSASDITMVATISCSMISGGRGSMMRRNGRRYRSFRASHHKREQLQPP